MPLFECSNCHCIENRDLSRYKDFIREGRLPLCSQCDPEIGEWHNIFRKTKVDSQRFIRGEKWRLYSTNFHIDLLMLNMRPCNCLINSNILRWNDLINKTDKELLSIDNLGKKSLQEIKKRIKEGKEYYLNELKGYDPNEWYWNREDDMEFKKLNFNPLMKALEFVGFVAMFVKANNLLKDQELDWTMLQDYFEEELRKLGLAS